MTQDQSHARVGVFCGSASDVPVVSKCLDVLEKLDIAYDFRVLSAHRTPVHVKETVAELEANGAQVFIAAAGLAAHLAGAIAATTTCPVIGIPLGGNTLSESVDAMYSTVQMPPGMPVATVAAGSPGATNAGLLAGQILAVGDPELFKRVFEERQKRREQVLAADAEHSRKYR